MIENEHEISIISKALREDGVDFIIDTDFYKSINITFPIRLGPIVTLKIMPMKGIHFSIKNIVNSIPTDRFSCVIEQLNVFNSKLFYVNFYISDGSICLDYDLPGELSDEDIGKGTLHIYHSLRFVLDHNFVELMSKIYRKVEFKDHNERSGKIRELIRKKMEEVPENEMKSDDIDDEEKIEDTDSNLASDKEYISLKEIFALDDSNDEDE